MDSSILDSDKRVPRAGAEKQDSGNCPTRGNPRLKWKFAA